MQAVRRPVRLRPRTPRPRPVNPATQPTPTPTRTRADRPAMWHSPAPVRTRADRPAAHLNPATSRTRADRPVMRRSPAPIRTRANPPAVRHNPAPIRTRAGRPAVRDNPASARTRADRPVVRRSPAVERTQADWPPALEVQRCRGTGRTRADRPAACLRMRRVPRPILTPGRSLWGRRGRGRVLVVTWVGCGGRRLMGVSSREAGRPGRRRARGTGSRTEELWVVVSRRVGRLGMDGSGRSRPGGSRVGRLGASWAGSPVGRLVVPQAGRARVRRVGGCIGLRLMGGSRGAKRFLVRVGVGRRGGLRLILTRMSREVRGGAGVISTEAGPGLSSCLPGGRFRPLRGRGVRRLGRRPPRCLRSRGTSPRSGSRRLPRRSAGGRTCWSSPG